jgi:hypothetical protein
MHAPYCRMTGSESSRDCFIRFILHEEAGDQDSSAKHDPLAFSQQVAQKKASLSRAPVPRRLPCKGHRES